MKLKASGIGIMSGTSLDGIDLAWCNFSQKENQQWEYSILRAEMVPYSDNVRALLANATTLSARDYCQLHVDLGEVIAEQVNRFVGGGPKPDFIASHGHTVFHQPQQGVTTQIGSGAVIAARTGITTICDFRSLDVALHGQGAPLVPIGDEFLFPQYDACLNLGGFSNISYRKENQRVAFDISPCNMMLNYLSNCLGKPYDKDGTMAKTGQVITSMLDELNALPYYKMLPPKSLGKEWFEDAVLPILQKYLKNQRVEDCLRTCTEHIVQQIVCALPDVVNTLLVTGGGALNSFLIQSLREKWAGRVSLPEMQTIQFKEALIFAFLGFLRINHQNNCLKSVTGADISNCGGCIWIG